MEKGKCCGEDSSGNVTGCILISSHLHWLAGGVLTLQTPGSSSARVLLMVTPSEDAPPPSTTHRHRGFDVTTLDSAEQHDELG
jgi:hypothetical protein